MTVNSRRKARIARERKVIMGGLLGNPELIEESLKNDPVWQRAVEIGSKNHLPLTEDVRRAEQEIANK